VAASLNLNREKVEASGERIVVAISSGVSVPFTDWTQSLLKIADENPASASGSVFQRSLLM
jgi:hypothetical protein